MQHLTIVTTGGTIDKIYFDDKSDYQIGEPQIGGILRELGVAFQFNVIPIIRKDSLHITAEDREKIFEPFYRRQGANQATGTGLGLSIVRQIARLHGGDVAYEPRAGGGCRFVVTLAA